MKKYANIYCRGINFIAFLSFNVSKKKKIIIQRNKIGDVSKYYYSEVLKRIKVYIQFLIHGYK